MMKALSWIGFALLLVVATARSETWNTTAGPVEGKLAGIYGPLVALKVEKAVVLVPVDSFTDADLERVAEFVSQQPKTAPLWRDSKSTLAKALVGHLQIRKGSNLVDYDVGDRPEPEFYMIYFGAGWCGPCREFSHRLVETYQRMQKAAGGRFEVIFVSSDQSEGDQNRYVNEVPMSWPILDYSKRDWAPEVLGWKADSIPCVVVLTRDGNALFHSHHGKEYLGPDQPLEQLEAVLAATAPGNPAVKRALHRLAVIQRVRSAGSRELKPAPYLVGLDLRRYQTLKAESLLVRLQIDEKGLVTDAVFEPKQPAVIDYDLVADASRWLFLPAVRDGHPVASKVSLPLDLRR